MAPEHLADDGADDREAEGDVKAGDDPGRRRGQHHMAIGLPAAGPEHARVRDQVLVDLAHALKGIEEDAEEHEHRGGHHLGLSAHAEGDDEQRREHDARDRVQDLDVRVEHIGEEAGLTEADADDHARNGPEQEAEHGLLQRDPDVGPDRPVLGAVREPILERGDDPTGPSPEERVDDLDPGSGEQLPEAEHEDERGDPSDSTGSPCAVAGRCAQRPRSAPRTAPAPWPVLRARSRWVRPPRG